MEVSGQLHASAPLPQGKLAGLRAGLDAVEKRKSLASDGNRTAIPRSSNPWPGRSLYRLSYSVPPKNRWIHK
jgi:hypothetical protein